MNWPHHMFISPNRFASRNCSLPSFMFAHCFYTQQPSWNGSANTGSLTFKIGVSSLFALRRYGVALKSISEEEVVPTRRNFWTGMGGRVRFEQQLLIIGYICLEPENLRLVYINTHLCFKSNSRKNTTNVLNLLGSPKLDHGMVGPWRKRSRVWSNFGGQQQQFAVTESAFLPWLNVLSVANFYDLGSQWKGPALFRPKLQRTLVSPNWCCPNRLEYWHPSKP